MSLALPATVLPIAMILAAAAATAGNAWHLPALAEPGIATMREPVRANPGAPVLVYTGNQFAGDGGNPGNQLQTGSAVLWRIEGAAAWTEAALTFHAEAGSNKYFVATVPGAEAGAEIEYYLRIAYSDHPTTFVSGADERSAATLDEAVARATPFRYVVERALHPGGDFVSISADGFEGRIYTATGHVALLGGADELDVAPGFARVDGAWRQLGAVTASQPDGDALVVTQALGAGSITARLSWAAAGVLRYEVTDWGGAVIDRVEIDGASPTDERFYGLGEKFDRVEQSGKVARVMPVDAPGAKGDRSYKVVPWFVTTRGHGFHLDSAFESFFDLRASRDDRWAVTQIGAGLAFHLIGGPTPADALSRWSDIAGRPPTPPAWAFAPWMSTDAWRDGGEIRYVVEQYRALGIPGSVLVFDSPWEVGYNDLVWNETQFGRGGTYDGVPYAGFASAADMMTFLGDNGFRAVLWMTPFVNVESNDEGVPGAQTGRASIYDEAAANGYLVREAPGGAPLVVTWWKGRGSPVDFTNPAARAWWQGKLAALVTASGGVIAGWKCDDGESDFIPETAAYFDGRRGDVMRTGYSVEYQHAVWDVLGAEGILWSRSGFTGTQAFPGQWAGDNEPNFGAENGLRSVIVAGLSSAMSGWAIWGSDIGGYQDANPSSTPENLFMRWAQFGAMSPIMQMHRQIGAGKQYPWSYGDAALANYVQYARLHTALFPYLYTYADGASRTGLPIIRPPVLEHPDDPATWDLAHTYYLGESLLVAPVVDNVATTRTVYLPGGTWYDWFTGEIHAGGATIEWQSADQTRMPLFVRAGAIVPMIPEATASLIEVPDELDVRVYPDGVSSFSVYDGTELGCAATADRVTVTVDSRARTVELRVRTAEPVAVLRDGAPVAWTRAGDFTIVRFEHAGGATAVEVVLVEAGPGPDAGPGDGVPATSGCCQSGSGGGSGVLLVLMLLVSSHRRRGGSAPG